MKASLRSITPMIPTGVSLAEALDSYTQQMGFSVGGAFAIHHVRELSADFRFGDEAAIACLPKGTATAVIPNAPHMWYPLAPKAGAEAILAFIDKH